MNKENLNKAIVNMAKFKRDIIKVFDDFADNYKNQVMLIENRKVADSEIAERYLWALEQYLEALDNDDSHMDFAGKYFRFFGWEDYYKLRKFLENMCLVEKEEK